MKLHIITIGAPKLSYAKAGWDEYFNRLKHYHQLRATQISDRHNNATKILETAGNSYKVALEIEGTQFASNELPLWLDKLALSGREVSFIIGGPDGLPKSVLSQVDYKLSLSKRTMPHDLAMVALLEALYRASTISAGHPYHR